MKRCLYCYQILAANETDFHPACSRKIFDQPDSPVLPYSDQQMTELALQIVKSQISVTGVQAKLSLELARGEQRGEPKRFTIVGLSGGYILKPPTAQYKQLPEVEDLTMHLARIAKIDVVPHCLIRLRTGVIRFSDRQCRYALEEFLPDPKAWYRECPFPCL